MFLFLHLVCLYDNDDAVKNNPIIVLCNHEGIAIIETMAPTLNSETVKCWLPSMCSKVFDIWMVYVGQETEKCQLILKCWSRNRRFNWFRSLYFELRYMKGNLHWLSMAWDLRKTLIYPCFRYIKFGLFNMKVNGVTFGPWQHFDIHHVFVKTESDIQ